MNEARETQVCRTCGVDEGELHLSRCAEANNEGIFSGYDDPTDDGDAAVLTGAGREYVGQDEESETRSFDDPDVVARRVVRPTIAEIERDIDDGVAGNVRPDGVYEILSAKDLVGRRLVPHDPVELLRAMQKTTALHVFVAQVCHAVNRVHSLSLGEESPPWSECSQEVRDSATEGVRVVFENPDTTDKELHDGWMRRKVSEGWRWGTVKSELYKTHPCLVPYDELPEEQRTKDALFRAVCLSFLGERT